MVMDRHMSAWYFCTMCPDTQKHLKKLYVVFRPSSVGADAALKAVGHICSLA